MDFVMPKTSKIKIEHNLICSLCGFQGPRTTQCPACKQSYLKIWRQLNREYRNEYLKLLRAHKRKELAAKNMLLDVQVEAITALSNVIASQSTLMQLSRRPYVSMKPITYLGPTHISSPGRVINFRPRTKRRA